MAEKISDLGALGQMNLMEQDVSIVQQKSVALTLMSVDWIMYYNQSHSLGAENSLQGNTIHCSPGREPSYMAYESENLFLNHREAIAG